MARIDFNLTDFIESWHAYSNSQRFPDSFPSLSDDDDDFDDEFAEMAGTNAPRHLSEDGYLEFYLGADAKKLQCIRGFFKGHKPSAIYNQLTTGIPLKLHVCFEFETTRHGSFVQMVVDNEESDPSFLAERIFERKLKHVTHETMHITSGGNVPMGRGIGKQFTANSIGLYHMLGMTKIIIPDPQQTGTLAWLKAGFRVPQNHWEASIKDSFIETVEIMHNDGLISSPFYHQLLEKSDSSKILNAIARSSKTVTQHGREEFLSDVFFTMFLEGKTFREKFECGYEANLLSPKQQDSFNRYFEQSGVRIPRFASRLNVA